MSLVSPVFEQHYKEYIDQLGGLDFKALGPEVGGRVTTTDSRGPGLEISYFNRPYRVSSAGITDGEGRITGYDTCIILCRYLLMAGDWAGKTLVADDRAHWAGFRDLKDSGPLTVYFKNNVEVAIAKILAGRLPVPPQSLDSLNPSPPDMELQYDLALKVHALPRVPMLVLINDEDDGFPSSCSVLFQSKGETYLDAECIAMAGFRLADLIRKFFP